MRETLLYNRELQNCARITTWNVFAVWLIPRSVRDCIFKACARPPCRAVYKIPADQTTERLGASPGGPVINNKVDQ